MEDWNTKYQENSQQSKNLSKQAPAVMQKFSELHAAVDQDGAVSRKNKELIALGIAIADRCENCIMAHTKAAINLGVSLEEITETIEVAVLMGGGPSVAFGGKVLNIAEALLAKK